MTRQSQPRLGDVLDDYCPRERRVTNHAVVALVEGSVKLTRCTTCDTEHDYKAAKVPARRAKLTKVLPLGDGNGRAPEVSPGPPLLAGADIDSPDGQVQDTEPTGAHEAPVANPPSDEGSVRRPLIRATLPRQEGPTTERRMPEFTIRQGSGRGEGLRESPRGRTDGRRNGSGRGNGAAKPVAGWAANTTESRGRGRTTARSPGRRALGRSPTADRGPHHGRAGRHSKKRTK